jgi:TonB family protein
VPIAPANASAAQTTSHISDSQASSLWNDSTARTHSADNHLAAKPSPGAVSSNASGVSSGSGAKANAKAAGNADQPTRYTAALQRTSLNKDSGTVREKEVASVAPPQIPGSANPAALASILTANAALPRLSPTMSRGVSGGQLLHRVPPVYPEQAKMFHMQGKVILDATVMEDGSVRDPKVVQGEPVLARCAVEAVKQWRYQPFVLDGKPVKTETRITVDFRLPSQIR